jgi:hypothetical protein
MIFIPILMKICHLVQKLPDTWTWWCCKNDSFWISNKLKWKKRWLTNKETRKHLSWLCTGTAVSPMHSKYYTDLVSVMCLVVTQQEGYLYHFNMHDLQEPHRLQQAACVTVYPFTAPVTAAAMERFVLHALTETGLETYTLRGGHYFISALDPVSCLSVSILYITEWTLLWPLCMMRVQKVSSDWL